MSLVLVDSGAFIALNNSRDHHHRRAMEWLRGFRGRLVTTSDVVDETVTRLRYDGGIEQARRLRGQIEALEQRRRLSIVYRDRALDDQAWEVKDALPDVPLSFTDAVSVAVARNRGCEAVFGFDRDFLAAGLMLVPNPR